MTTSKFLNLEPTEPARNGNGWYLIEGEEGTKPVAFQRATTLAGMLENRFKLEAWKVRQTALGLAERPDLIAAIATSSDKQQLDTLCQQALNASGGNSSATIGTALHAATENWDRDGTKPPAMFAEHVERYAQALSDAGIHIIKEHIEQVVVNDHARVAGMFDRAIIADGETCVADLKTGKDIKYAAATYSIQQAIYVTANRWYDWRAKKIIPVVPLNQEKALIIHLPAAGGDCELIWLDLKPGIEALEHAMWVREWQKPQALLTPFTPKATPPAAAAAVVEEEAAQETHDQADRATQLREQLPPSGTPELKAFATRWPTGVPGPSRYKEWTQSQMDQIERTFELGFTTSETTTNQIAEQLRNVDTSAGTATIRTPLQTPPDGEIPDRAYCNTTIEMREQLTDHQTLILKQLIKDAVREQVRWEHETYKSQRRALAARAAVVLIAQFTDDQSPVEQDEFVTAALHQIITDTDPRHSYKAGVQIGLMTERELYELITIATTATIQITDTGLIQFVTDTKHQTQKTQEQDQ